MSRPVPAQTGLAGTWARLRRLVPYFRGSRLALPCTVIATVVAAVTEPVIPAPMEPLLDHGFQGGAFSLWMVPLALLGLFALRGVAGFVAQYSLAYMANQAMVALRQALFEEAARGHLLACSVSRRRAHCRTRLCTRSKPAQHCW